MGEFRSPLDGKLIDPSSITAGPKDHRRSALRRLNAVMGTDHKTLSDAISHAGSLSTESQAKDRRIAELEKALEPFTFSEDDYIDANLDYNWQVERFIDLCKIRAAREALSKVDR